MTAAIKTHGLPGAQQRDLLTHGWMLTAPSDSGAGAGRSAHGATPTACSSPNTQTKPNITMSMPLTRTERFALSQEASVAVFFGAAGSVVHRDVLAGLSVLRGRHHVQILHLEAVGMSEPASNMEQAWGQNGHKKRPGAVKSQVRTINPSMPPGNPRIKSGFVRAEQRCAR